MTTIGTAALWQPGGWSGPVALDLADGRIRRSQALEPAAATNASWLLPGIPNLHSHAFQRAMAGFAERRSAGQGNDSFWTWRETMYAFAARMTPETLYAVACQLYVEMLEAGYTWVCEFHYLHHQADGRAYDDPAAMSKALIAAAADTGIGLTLLPVLYMSAGFDGSPLAPRQRRFGHDLEAYLRLLSSLQGLQCDRLRLGAALHSLRAVPPQALSGLMESEVCDEMPIHIHIAEQPAEVAECLAVRGARPVQWLLENAPVDERWCLVHATHMTEAETRAVAASSATVAICPTTEANLGDGVFSLPDYLAAGGAWGIGSDSHISVSPVEELRWLEYGQRLTSGQRAVAASAGTPSVGETLLAGALHGGRACGAAVGLASMPMQGRSDQPAAGQDLAGIRADLVALDGQAPILAGHGRESLIDAWLFSGNRNLVDRVWTDGRERVNAGRHHRREPVADAYRRALKDLLAGS